MAFTASQAFDLLRTAFSRNRLPHALLIVGDEHQGASRLILQLLELMNGIRADHLDSVRDEYCRLVRPKSKSRRILRDDIRAVEPFLQQRAAEGKWKIAVFMDAERMNDEAANAFLKTLEEPPSQCLLILSTSQPDQLLQTIISRCVRVNLLQSAEFRLTPIQEALLPHWLETCRNLDNDLAALAFRSKFVDVMTEAKAAITKNLNQALKDEAKEAAQGTDTSDWESRNKDANTAQIETEYLEQHNQALELLISWFGQAALIASGAWTSTHAIPLWVKIACAVAIASGTWIGGWRIIRTMGKGLVDISPTTGLAADSSSGWRVRWRCRHKRKVRAVAVNVMAAPAMQASTNGSHSRRRWSNSSITPAMTGMKSSIMFCNST